MTLRTPANAARNHLADFAKVGLSSTTQTDHPLEPTDPTQPPVGWGVVGPGVIAHRVVPDIAMLSDAHLVAVSSRDHQRAQEFAQRHGFVRWYADGSLGSSQGVSTSSGSLTGVEALATDPEVDVVYVASPHGYHHDHVSHLLRAGKHVVCEKALATTEAEVRDLVNLAAAHGVLLMEAVWTAMTPGFRRAMQLVDHGVIGTVHSVTGAIGFHATPDPEHRLFSPADGGGATLDMLVYPLLWSDALQGEIHAINVIGSVGPTGVDDDVAIQVKREHGWAQLSATLRRVPATGVTLSGTEGWLRVDGRLHNPPQLEWTNTQRQADGMDPVVETISTIGAGYVPQMREATRCIRHGLAESPYVPWALSLSRARLFDTIRSEIGL
ncbi:MAG: Gfo/Idh/MocA family oxidoreductase [Kocuria sp.]|nr:Gfo/Idh/MocA family oxidoreductase [Kocuria sp.]